MVSLHQADEVLARIKVKQISTSTLDIDLLCLTTFFSQKSPQLKNR